MFKKNFLDRSIVYHTERPPLCKTQCAYKFLPRDAMLARYTLWPCVCLVCLSFTSRSSTKTTKHRITRTTPHDSPGTLRFSEAKDLSKIPPRSPHAGAPNAGMVG